jgi:methylenetetrahydrofolate reductase (NADPH)
MDASITTMRNAAARDFLKDFSIEITPGDTRALSAAADTLDPGTSVYLTAISGATYHDTVAAAVRLRQQGFESVPHVAARYLAGFTQLTDYLARLNGEAGVTRALVIAGDSNKSAGPFDSSLQLVETGLFVKHHFKRLGFAAYPEGHPKIPLTALDAALRAKIARTRGDGLDAYAITQFCFEAAPILALCRRLRAEGVDVPIRVGLAGPASLTTLMKFALRCGVGNSVRALALHGPSIARLLSEADPGAIIDRIAEERAAEPSLGIEGLHFFVFGALKRTAAWARARQRAV